MHGETLPIHKGGIKIPLIGWEILQLAICTLLTGCPISASLTQVRGASTLDQLEPFFSGGLIVKTDGDTILFSNLVLDKYFVVYRPWDSAEGKQTIEVNEILQIGVLKRPIKKWIHEGAFWGFFAGAKLILENYPETEISFGRHISELLLSAGIGVLLRVGVGYGLNEGEYQTVYTNPEFRPKN